MIVHKPVTLIVLLNLNIKLLFFFEYNKILFQFKKSQTPERNTIKFLSALFSFPFDKLESKNYLVIKTAAWRSGSVLGS